MTPKEKAKDLVNTFYYSLPNNGSQEGINSTTRRYEEAKQCALIAEDFAIGFAEWYRVKCILSSLDYHLTTKELLEMFKKDYENKTV